MYTVYATKTTLDLIQNLYTHYTCIYVTDMSDNDERLWSPYNEEEPLKGLIKRLNGCADFAAVASDLVSETQLIRIAYRLVADTVHYPEDFWAWRTWENKYWTAFQAHFIEVR